MSDLQRDLDIMEIERLVYATGLREHADAWQRIRARLTPDREKVARAIAGAVGGNPRIGEVPATYMRAADAALDAARGNG